MERDPLEDIDVVASQEGLCYMELITETAYRRCSSIRNNNNNSNNIVDALFRKAVQGSETFRSDDSNMSPSVHTSG